MASDFRRHARLVRCRERRRRLGLARAEPHVALAVIVDLGNEILLAATGVAIQVYDVRCTLDFDRIAVLVEVAVNDLVIDRTFGPTRAERNPAIAMNDDKA
jgi:hypothetical protein